MFAFAFGELAFHFAGRGAGGGDGLFCFLDGQLCALCFGLLELAELASFGTLDHLAQALHEELLDIAVGDGVAEQVAGTEQKLSFRVIDGEFGFVTTG